MSKKKRMIIDIKHSYYLELEEMAKKHIIHPTELAEQIVEAAVQEYLNRCAPNLLLKQESGGENGK